MADTEHMTDEEAREYAHAMLARENIAIGLYGAYRLEHGIEETRPWEDTEESAKQILRGMAEKILGEGFGPEYSSLFPWPIDGTER